MTTKNQLEHPIIFFDDVCGMCNCFVDRISCIDRERTFVFAPLQGSTARDLLPPVADDACPWSLVYLAESGIHDQSEAFSEAFLEIYKRIGGVWRLLSCLRLVPRFIRTPVYRLIARNRTRWFGKSEVCRVSLSETRERFLP